MTTLEGHSLHCYKRHLLEQNISKQSLQEIRNDSIFFPPPPFYLWLIGLAVCLSSSHSVCVSAFCLLFALRTRSSSSKSLIFSLASLRSCDNNLASLVLLLICLLSLSVGSVLGSGLKSSALGEAGSSL